MFNSVAPYRRLRVITILQPQQRAYQRCITSQIALLLAKLRIFHYETVNVITTLFPCTIPSA